MKEPCVSGGKLICLIEVDIPWIFCKFVALHNFVSNRWNNI